MVSVVVPAYNMEKYISRCLDAICGQSFRDLEILVIDDGSTDKTYEIACEYAKSDSRVTAIHKENGGVSSARNFGIEKSHGEYILFADPDDLIEIDGIEVLVKAMTDSDVDLVSCEYSRWHDDGTKLQDYDFISGKRVFSSDNDILDFILHELADYHVGYEVWNKLFKTDIIRDNNIKFSEKCRIGEDLAFNIKYLMNIKDMDNISERCVRYNIRDDSAMGNHTDLSKKIIENNLLLEDICSYITASKNELFSEKFPLIYVKLMEKAYIGHTPLEITDACKKTGDDEFIRTIYKKLDNYKEDLYAIYPEDIARIKYRYHMYVKAGICGESTREKVNRTIYNLYRRLRGREILENWKMPY